jgi:hypothetical protein
MTVTEALMVAGDDLPDGAWMAMLCELTGRDAGEVSNELAALSDNGRLHLVDGAFVEPGEAKATTTPKAPAAKSRKSAKRHRWKANRKARRDAASLPDREPGPR